MQTLATLLANKTQHCWAQHVASVWTPYCVLLRVVATCWMKFKTGQTSSKLKITDNATLSLLNLAEKSLIRSRPRAALFVLILNHARYPANPRLIDWCLALKCALKPRRLTPRKYYCIESLQNRNQRLTVLSTAIEMILTSKCPCELF